MHENYNCSKLLELLVIVTSNLIRQPRSRDISLGLGKALGTRLLIRLTTFVSAGLVARAPHFRCPHLYVLLQQP